MNTVGGKVKNDTKKIAQQIAKQIAREPLEILKTAATQTTGIEKLPPSENQNHQDNSSISSDKNNTPNEQQLKLKSQRLMQAYEKEIEDIRKQKEEKKLQELQQDQIQKQQNEQQQEETRKGLFGIIIPQGKKKKNMLGRPNKKGPSGPTGTTKTEVRKPPSG